MPKKPEPRDVDGALVALNAIRTETVLSKLPVHRLQKHGRLEINIVQRDESGEVSLRWKVTHDTPSGPGPLAYKLDTLVVNRRIDEDREVAHMRGDGRALSKRIRLGSLSEIAKELGLADSGQNRKLVREALEANAGTSITAKLSYKASDGTARWLDTKFSRYSVVLTGRRFSDGKAADAVYIILNEPYWEVLSSVPFRPLDYDYLKQLAPGAQRWYEVASFKVFAALRHGYEFARLRYSEYCTSSAQMKYEDYDHMKKQMYKVHLPHIRSGYISKVAYEEETTGDGKLDWIMLYTPGPKARAEYRQFSRRTPHAAEAIDEPAVVLEAALEVETRAVSESEDLRSALVEEIVSAGVSRTWARRYATDLDDAEADRARHVIDYWAIVGVSRRWENPAGMLRRLLELQRAEGISIPASVPSRTSHSAGKERKAEAERAINEEAQRFVDEQQAIERRIDGLIESMSEAALAEVRSEARHFCESIANYASWSVGAREREQMRQFRRLIAKRLT